MDRRAFLKIAGIAATACAIPPVFAAVTKPPTTLRDLITHVEIYLTNGKPGPVFEVPDTWFVSPNRLINGELIYGPTSAFMVVGGLRFFGPLGDVARLQFSAGAMALTPTDTLKLVNCGLEWT